MQHSSAVAPEESPETVRVPPSSLHLHQPLTVHSISLGPMCNSVNLSPKVTPLWTPRLSMGSFIDHVVYGSTRLESIHVFEQAFQQDAKKHANWLVSMCKPERSNRGREHHNGYHRYNSMFRPTVSHSSGWCCRVPHTCGTGHRRSTTSNRQERLEDCRTAGYRTVIRPYRWFRVQTPRRAFDDGHL